MRGSLNMRKYRKQSRKAGWQELIAKGERFSRGELLVCCGAVLVLSFLLGICMQLEWSYLLAVGILCILQAPGMYFHYKKQIYEKKRFDHTNAYISHMTQAFTGNSKILLSLKETRNIFPRGNMHKILTKAVCHIEGARDVELAETEALGFIAEEYDCERVHTLHDFLLKAESRGGSCEEEFRLLESIRQIWEQTALKYKNTVFMARNLVTFEYFMLILVCIFMLYQFPEELNILHLPLVQILNMFLIICFFATFSRMNKKLSGSMLENGRRLEESQVHKKFACVREFQGEKEMLRHLPFALAELVFVLICFFWLKSSFLLAWGVGMFFLILFWGHIRYVISFQQIRSEVKRVFPGWLFDLLLLMQSENVSVALFKSVQKAPAVLQGELKQLQKELEENPMSPDAFLSFLAEFCMPEVESTMRKLYALGNGTGAEREVMNLIIDTSMTMLADAQKQKLRLKGDLFSLYYMLPTIPVMVCMAGYGIALMFLIFQNIKIMI